MKRTIITIIALVVTLSSSAENRKIYHRGWIDFNKNGKKDIYEDSTRGVDERVADLLSQMTIEEKSCQMATLYGFARVLRDSLPTEGWKKQVWKDGIANIDEQLNGVGKVNKVWDLIYPFSNHVEALNTTQRWFVEETRLGIPVEFSNEGVHGLNHSMATSLPAPIGIGSSWNRDLVLEAGQIVGREAKLLGYHTVYAPILDISRDPRWGRVIETYGEDPFLVTELGVEMARGVQSQGVGSTLKHFAAYSVPKGGRDGNCRTDPHITPRELHELHLYPFRRVIKEVDPLGVMSSYNDWDGVPVTASHYFLTELLRDEYGFTGYVVSDSQAAEFVYEKHKVAESYKDGVRQVVEAGLNVKTNFSQPARYINSIRDCVKEGLLSMDVIDKMVEDVLSVKFRLGLFDTPYVKDPAAADKHAGSDKNIEFIKRMQAQTMVLLKNDGNILPLDKNKIKSLCIAGPLAAERNYMTSRYGPNKLPSVSVLSGLKSYLEGSGVKVNYAKGCNVVDSNWPDSEIVPTPLDATEKRAIAAAVESANQSDVIIAVLGEDAQSVGESRSRTSLSLPGRQQQLLEALYATGKPVVLVLINGQPLTINWADRYIPSILEAWFPGHLGGEVIAEMLFGDHNPGGKLPITFPKSLGQIEYNFPYKRGSHGTQAKSGPNGSGKTRVLGALYPFGYGLSYTTFEYSNLNVDTAALGSKDEVSISLTLRNSGACDGDEVVQLYVSDLYSSVVTYESVLRGFERVTLKSGESREIRFTLKMSDLEILDRDMKWTAEPGDFEIRIGTSSEDIKLRKTFKYKGKSSK